MSFDELNEFLATLQETGPGREAVLDLLHRVQQDHRHNLAGSASFETVQKVNRFAGVFNLDPVHVLVWLTDVVTDLDAEGYDAHTV